MKILLIEDDENKRKALIDFVKTELPKANLEQSYSFQSGLKKVMGNAYDFILLDMSMPSFDVTPKEQGGRLRPFGGREILDALHADSILTTVIIVTQFDIFGDERIKLTELDRELKNKYANIYKGCVFYSSAETNWRNNLSVILTTLGFME